MTIGRSIGERQVGCNGAREVVPDVVGADRVLHGAARLADGSVLLAGGRIEGDDTPDALWLPAECDASGCEPNRSGPLLPEARSRLEIAALPEGGAVALGAGGALHLDPVAWEASSIDGDPAGAMPAVFPLPTGQLVILSGEDLAFVAPRTLFPAEP